MMKRFFVIALFVLGFGQLYAQPVRDTAWTKAGYFGLKSALYVIWLSNAKADSPPADQLLKLTCVNFNPK